MAAVGFNYGLQTGWPVYTIPKKEFEKSVYMLIKIYAYYSRPGCCFGFGPLSSLLVIFKIEFYLSQCKAAKPVLHMS